MGAIGPVAHFPFAGVALVEGLHPRRGHVYLSVRSIVAVFYVASPLTPMLLLVFSRRSFTSKAFLVRNALFGAGCFELTKNCFLKKLLFFIRPGSTSAGHIPSSLAFYLICFILFCAEN